MKPVLCKKTGYSSLDTFIALIKCLVFTMAFLFLGINLDTKKISATTDYIVGEDLYYLRLVQTSGLVTDVGTRFTHYDPYKDNNVYVTTYYVNKNKVTLEVKPEHRVANSKYCLITEKDSNLFYTSDELCGSDKNKWQTSYQFTTTLRASNDLIRYGYKVYTPSTNYTAFYVQELYLYHDTLAPTDVTVTCTASCDGWTASNVTASVSATDAGTGKITYKYKVGT